MTVITKEKEKNLNNNNKHFFNEPVLFLQYKISLRSFDLIIIQV